MKSLRHLPNFLTCLNLFCGCLAVVYISRNDLTVASWLVITAAVIDFLDGFAARVLNAFTETGKQLDSLADMVTFGLVPGYMMYQLLAIKTDLFLLKNQWLIFIPFLITIFSALRLAKFNIDKRQTVGFIGLPTPACTLFIISLPLIIQHQTGFAREVAESAVFIVISSIVLSFLLVAEIPMFSFKFKNFSWKSNKVRFIFLLLSLIAFVFLKWLALPIIVVMYISFSILVNRNRVPAG